MLLPPTNRSHPAPPALATEHGQDAREAPLVLRVGDGVAGGQEQIAHLGRPQARKSAFRAAGRGTARGLRCGSARAIPAPPPQPPPSRVDGAQRAGAMMPVAALLVRVAGHMVGGRRQARSHPQDSSRRPLFCAAPVVPRRGKDRHASVVLLQRGRQSTGCRRSPSRHRPLSCDAPLVSRRGKHCQGDLGR